MNKFTLFTPVNKLYFTRNLVTCTLFVLGLIPVVFEIYVLEHREHLTLFSSYFAYLSFLAILLHFISMLGNSVRQETLKGIIGGSLFFELDQIVINDEKYLLADIRKLNIYMNDYVGKISLNYRTANGRISRGVGNSIIIHLSNGDKKTFYFQQTDQYSNQHIREQLIHYHLTGKLHWLNLIDVLCINDYEEIQDFKKTLLINQ